MVMCALGDIFHAEVYKLIGDIDGVKAYIDDIIFLSKDSFENHIGQLRMIFRRLCATGLKVNAPKFSLGLKEIPYLGYLIRREGIKSDPNKVKEVMGIGRPSTTTEARALVVMVQYYRDMWPRRSGVLAPLTEAANGPKGRKILWNGTLEISSKELNRLVSDETLLTYTDWKLPFTFHNNAYDKQVGDVISPNYKHISFFSRRLSKPQRNYTTTEKELVAMVECLEQFRGSILGYGINLFSDHKNLVYVATLSEFQRVMRWRLIIKYFGPNI